jgi:lysophospholipase L1-like esterase
MMNFIGALAGILNSDVSLNILVDGNSLPAGQGSTTGNSFPEQLQRMSGITANDNPILNFAVGGQTTPQMIADAATQIDPQIDNTKDKNIIIVWEGRNDLVVNSATVQVAYENLRDYCQARQSAGWEVIILTLLPSWTAVYKGDNTVTGYNLLDSERIQVNTLLKNNQAIYSNYLVDVAAISGISNLGNNESLNYVFNTNTRPTTSVNGLFDDGTHMTDNGYFLIADAVNNVLIGF